MTIVVVLIPEFPGLPVADDEEEDVELEEHAAKERAYTARVAKMSFFMLFTLGRPMEGCIATRPREECEPQ
jgi:hypothetical protein